MTFTDAREAAEYLAAILAGGPRRLLVLDDVWSPAQLDVFPVAGRCARLVTTRNASLVGGAGVPILVDRMTQRQANAVLSAGLPGLPPAVSAQPVAETAGWPHSLPLSLTVITGGVPGPPRGWPVLCTGFPRALPRLVAAAGQVGGLGGVACQLDGLVVGLARLVTAAELRTVGVLVHQQFHAPPAPRAARPRPRLCRALTRQLPDAAAAIAGAAWTVHSSARPLLGLVNSRPG